jgi:DNA repair protein RadC
MNAQSTPVWVAGSSARGSPARAETGKPGVPRRPSIRAVHALMEQAFLETPAAEIIDSPTRAAPFLKARLAGVGYEVFGIVLLNAQHGVIAFEEVARGTISQTSVYPREILKRALAVINAAALLCVHQHPLC